MKHINRAAQSIESWWANSPTGNTPAARKILFPWQLTLLHFPLTFLSEIKNHPKFFARNVGKNCNNERSGEKRN